MLKASLPLILMFISLISVAQKNKDAEVTINNSTSNDRIIKATSSVVTNSEVVINGNKITYKATAGTLPVWDESNNISATLFYTYYQRTGIADQAKRPLVFSFNGGPGSASVWMHIGYTGPQILNLDDEGYPVQPYGLKDNSSSILDVADIVFVDPVNTGYSRILDSSTKMKFFGVNEDIKYLAEWMNTFVTRNNRWLSPKFIIGESYGTTRVSGLALELENNQWMYLNGVVLVSPTDLGLKRNGPLEMALYFPYYAATAWYHKALTNTYQQRDLVNYLPEVEDFTINELLPALTRGASLDAKKRGEIASKMSQYSGLNDTFILQHNLQISPDLFWKELLRKKGFTIGRLDSRYLGIDKMDGGDGVDYNAELSSWLHSFTPPINYYLREVLKYQTDAKYNMFGSVFPWDQNNNNTGENLRLAMTQNPNLHVLVQSGYYDGACDYFNAKYSLWQLDPGGKLKDRIKWEGYRSGHMMYLRKDDLRIANDHLRNFIINSIPKPGAPAKYELDQFKK